MAVDPMGRRVLDGLIGREGEPHLRLSTGKDAGTRGTNKLRLLVGLWVGLR